MTATLLTNARLIDPEAGEVTEGALLLEDGVIARRYDDSRAIREPYGFHTRYGWPFRGPRHRRHRRQGRRTGRAPQGELPHRRRSPPRPAASPPWSPAPTPCPPSTTPRRSNSSCAAPMEASPVRVLPMAALTKGRAGPRDDRDRLPDGRGRGRLHRLRPRGGRTRRSFQRCLTYATGARRAGHRPSAGAGAVGGRLHAPPASSPRSSSACPPSRRWPSASGSSATSRSSRRPARATTPTRSPPPAACPPLAPRQGGGAGGHGRASRSTT